MSVIAAVGGADRDMLIIRTKVKRYRPGKPPEWAADDSYDGGDMQVVKPFPILDVKARKEDDPRLRRLARISVCDRNEVREELRRIRQPEVVEGESGSRADLREEDEDAWDERRRLNKKKVLLQRRWREASPPEAVEEEVDEEYEYSETYSKEEAAATAVVFIRKPERETIAERERLAAEKRAEAEKKRAEERKRETKEIVIEKIKEVQNIQNELDPSIVADVDTDDDDANEYEAGMARERARIKREKEERETVLEKKKQKRRTATEEEMRELELAGKPKKKKRRVMLQKDYHKGAFFQSYPAGIARVDSIYLRDFSSPTGEDKMDNATLPKVMRVKSFGRRGRTKWTHLVEEDTTFWNAC